jgi:hypothetical protein
MHKDVVQRILAVRYRPKPDAAGPSWLTVLGHAKDSYPPTYLSSDHVRLYLFHQWQAKLRILDVEAIQTVPCAPRSHPFVERLVWHDSTGVLGSHTLLDGHRSGAEAP